MPMMTVFLSPEEAEVVHDALTAYHNTLLHELAKVDTRQFKEILRAREAAVTAVLERLTPVMAG